jgi:hypothetical protein
VNIFVLSEDPAIAASMHCDQHLHKMILESAQMLSTAARARSFSSIYPWLYQSAYVNHPCTRWVAASNHNMLWLCELCIALDEQRSGPHASMDIIHAVRDLIQEDFPYASSKAVSEFIFAGPSYIGLRKSLSIPQKYQQYYIHKYRKWLDTPRPMSYKGRPLPEFLQEFSDTIPHL